MQKIYPLYSKKSTTIIALHILFVIGFSIQAIYRFMKGDLFFAAFPLSIVIATLLSAYFTIYKSGPLTPRIEINDQYLIYKPEAFSRTIRYSWKEISTINISKLALTILTKSNKTDYLHIEEYRNIGKSFIDLIRELGKRNDIQVNI